MVVIQFELPDDLWTMRFEGGGDLSPSCCRGDEDNDTGFIHMVVISFMCTFMYMYICTEVPHSLM